MKGAKLNTAKWIFLFSSFLTVQIHAADKQTIHDQLEKLTTHFMGEVKTQSNGDQYWEGQQELNPVWDLLLFVALQRSRATNVDTLKKVRTQTLSRIFDPKWVDQNSGAWKMVPTGKADKDVTAAILLTLKNALGMTEKTNPDQLGKSWAWLNSHFRNAKSIDDKLIYSNMNILFRIFLAVVDVLPRSAAPLFPIKLLGLPRGYPMSPVDMGVFRTVMIPLTVWDFYHDLPFISAINPKFIADKGAQFGQMHVDEKLMAPFIKDVDQVFMAIGGNTWDRFTTFVDNILDPTDHNFWAQEGLGYILSRKQSGNTWYVFGSSLVSLMALNAARESRVLIGDPKTLNQPIDGGTHQLDNAVYETAAGLLAWRNLHPATQKDYFIPAARSNIWDSSLALQNLASLPVDLRVNTQAIEANVTKWMEKSAVKTPGDWTWWRLLNQSLTSGFAAWSFYPEAVWHPDTDDSASVLETLLNNPSDTALNKEALAWVLAQQNTDSGFAAWEQGSSHLTNELMQKLLVGFPRVSDFSQADVSSRIERMLLNAQKNPALASKALDNAIQTNCAYLKKTALPTKTSPTLPLWEGDWIVDYTYATAEAVATLLEAGDADPTCWSLDNATPYMEWFKTIQNKDNGWGESVDSYAQSDYAPGDSSALQTSYVMKALLTYEKFYRKANKGATSSYYSVIQSGVDYLLSKIEADGSIKPGSFTGVYIKGFIFSDYTLMPEYHTIGVLGEALKY